LVIQERQGMIAPREQKTVLSKTSDYQQRNKQPFGHRLAHHLAFTKSAQEPSRFPIHIWGMKPTVPGSTSIHHGIPATDRAWRLAHPAVAIDHGP
jgi:hypothetical protein